jgi:hypothetical protein
MDLEKIESVSGMMPDLAAKLYKNRLNFRDAASLVAASKDRQYTYARVNRCLLNLVLGITKDETMQFKENDSAPWLRVLGFRKSAAPLLSALKHNTDLPLITKTADAKNLLSKPLRPLFEKSLKTSELYRMIAENKTGRSMKNEFTQPITILPHSPSKPDTASVLHGVRS